MAPLRIFAYMCCPLQDRHLSVLPLQSLHFDRCRYDPELPERQKHRDFLRERVVFREVVPISDASVRAKIHQTYRMGYLKDVILPR
jgi:Component of IIS longevity pathway SMK-1